MLLDIQKGEPSIIAFVSQQEDEERDQKDLHFEEVGDKYRHKSPTILRFLEAVRNYVAGKMRDEGGTPHQHLRHLFQFYDYDYSNGLDVKEIQMACRRKMKLQISEAQALEIVDFYDRKQQGQICYDYFVDDVCRDVKPILTFTDLTPRGIAAAKKSLDTNPFIPKPFKAPKNRILEKFKQDVKIALVNKVNKLGGSAASWIRDAFVFWDPMYTRKISSQEQLIGVAKRLGVTISGEDAGVLMKCFDVYGTGEMHYEYLTQEIMREDPHFLTTVRGYIDSSSTTSRTPAFVQDCIQKIVKGVSKFVKHSGGAVQPRDILHGTCLRYDSERTGRISVDQLRDALAQLRVHVSAAQVVELGKWFDSDGSQRIDFNALVRQIYGSDVTTERLVLPKLKENPRASAVSMLAGGLNSKLMDNSARLETMSLCSNNSTSTLRSVRSHASSSRDTMGVAVPTMLRNLDVIENNAIKRARLRQKVSKIMTEKVKIERRLQTIEEQRKSIIAVHKENRRRK